MFKEKKIIHNPGWYWIDRPKTYNEKIWKILKVEEDHLDDCLLYCTVYNQHLGETSYVEIHERYSIILKSSDELHNYINEDGFCTWFWNFA